MATPKRMCTWYCEWYVFLSFCSHFPKVDVRFVKDVGLLDQMRGQCLKPELCSSGSRAQTFLQSFLPQMQRISDTHAEMDPCLSGAGRWVRVLNSLLIVKQSVYILLFSIRIQDASLNCGSMKCPSFQGPCRGVSAAQLLVHMSFASLSWHINSVFQDMVKSLSDISDASASQLKDVFLQLQHN